jgi:sugar phosphate permease
MNYAFAAVFGLIHGMGFSNFFRAMVAPGEHNKLVKQLLAFNIGVEIGQLLIVGFILLASLLAFNLAQIKQREWNLFISGGAAMSASILALERLPF